MLDFPVVSDTRKKIIHIDMDAFFASIEIRDNPDLNGQPVIIAKDPRQTAGRGVVSTCNYEARRFGIHAAMSAKEAYERCPQGIFIAGDYAHYRQVGLAVREIFYRYTDLVEPMSIDEAYLDVTDNKLGIASAIKIARLIQQDIWQEYRLTASAGVSYNKFLAKIASDMQKPKGLTVILPDEALTILKDVAISDFHGVGKRAIERLHAAGLYTGGDVQERDAQSLIDDFGRLGYEVYQKAWGIGSNQVIADRKRKSIGSERTYRKILKQEADWYKELRKLSDKLAALLKDTSRLAGTLVIKVRFSDFTTLTKRAKFAEPTAHKERLYQKSIALFESMPLDKKGVRLLGVTATDLALPNRVMDLFSEEGGDEPIC